MQCSASAVSCHCPAAPRCSSIAAPRPARTTRHSRARAAQTTTAASQAFAEHRPSCRWAAAGRRPCQRARPSPGRYSGGCAETHPPARPAEPPGPAAWPGHRPAAPQPPAPAKGPACAVAPPCAHAPGLPRRRGGNRPRTALAAAGHGLRRCAAPWPRRPAPGWPARRSSAWWKSTCPSSFVPLSRMPMLGPAPGAGSRPGGCKALAAPACPRARCTHLVGDGASAPPGARIFCSCLPNHWALG